MASSQDAENCIKNLHRTGELIRLFVINNNIMLSLFEYQHLKYVLSRTAWANDICGEGEVRVRDVVAEANIARRPPHQPRPQGRYERERGEWTFEIIHILLFILMSYIIHSELHYFFYYLSLRIFRYLFFFCLQNFLIEVG